MLMWCHESDPKVKLLFGDILPWRANAGSERWPNASTPSGSGITGVVIPGDAFTAKRGSGARGHGRDARLTRQGARKVVSGLVERGYARVIPSTADSRRRIVELTPRGREYFARWWPLFAR